jgi:hypothetical protein
VRRLDGGKYESWQITTLRPIQVLPKQALHMDRHRKGNGHRSEREGKGRQQPLDTKRNANLELKFKYSRAGEERAE